MWDIHCSNINDNLTALESLLTWELMLNSVKIRSYVPVLNLVIWELNGYPIGVKYHQRKCCQSFTHKLHSERLSKKSEQMQLQDQRYNDRLLTKWEETDTYIISPEATTRRSPNSSPENLPNISCHLLPKQMYILW